MLLPGVLLLTEITVRRVARIADGWARMAGGRFHLFVRSHQRRIWNEEKKKGTNNKKTVTVFATRFSIHCRRMNCFFFLVKLAPSRDQRASALFRAMEGMSDDLLCLRRCESASRWRWWKRCDCSSPACTRWCTVWDRTAEPALPAPYDVDFVKIKFRF